MNTDEVAEQPIGVISAETAAFALDRFAGRNARVPGSTVVHAMRPARFLGRSVPGLGCGTAVGGWDWSRLLPSAEPITCSRCRRSRSSAADDDLFDERAQLSLDFGGLG
ncbi:hypothetical protein [Actinoalloteichus hymeniacidonis]|uniref:Uncharacterized protein n=1 Tax=Actinoalloteichus hymeniacidonis TaxID=340345 RepID=A0AAC9MYE1_9PSEU|nr:hypothetical protein [Actinoalloteichus hymeniacidonis]AOS62806.1 hypothetical protein TL08_09955 [Actinoalloteichus hymeniacidonis]MBB5909163.1 hypothetical protein [Actinoalloteichus hymeniacidonis]